MNEANKYLVKILMKLETKFKQNNVYSTEQMYRYIHDVFRKLK